MFADLTYGNEVDSLNEVKVMLSILSDTYYERTKINPAVFDIATKNCIDEKSPRSSYLPRDGALTSTILPDRSIKCGPHIIIIII